MFELLITEEDLIESENDFIARLIESNERLSSLPKNSGNTKYIRTGFSLLKITESVREKRTNNLLKWEKIANFEGLK